MNRLIENVLTKLLFVSVGPLIWFFKIQPPTDQNFVSLLSASLTFSGILVGFLATIQSIIASIQKKEGSVTYQIFNTDKYRGWLIGYFHVASAFLTIFALLNLVLFFIPYCKISVWILAIWATLAACSLSSFFRVYWVCTKMIAEPPPENQRMSDSGYSIPPSL